jgi:hypothetical protein
MTRRKKGEKEPSDSEKVATDVAEDTSESLPASEESTKNPHAVALGRLGAQKGGRARAEKLTPEQRSEIARKAVQARWAKKKSKP